MLPTEIETRLKAKIAEHLGVDEAQVVPSARFSDDLHADSLDLVEMVMAFEEEFGIEIPDEAAEKLVTVQEAMDYINIHSGPSVGIASTATDDPAATPPVSQDIATDGTNHDADKAEPN